LIDINNKEYTGHIKFN